jgi:hypothetical protein
MTPAPSLYSYIETHAIARAFVFVAGLRDCWSFFFGSVLDPPPLGGSANAGMPSLPLDGLDLVAFSADMTHTIHRWAEPAAGLIATLCGLSMHPAIYVNPKSASMGN